MVVFTTFIIKGLNSLVKEEKTFFIKMMSKNLILVCCLNFIGGRKCGSYFFSIQMNKNLKTSKKSGIKLLTKCMEL